MYGARHFWSLVLASCNVYRVQKVACVADELFRLQRRQAVRGGGGSCYACVVCVGREGRARPDPAAEKEGGGG